MVQLTGEVSGTGSVNTVVSTDEGITVILNGVLLESTVQSPRTSASESGTDQG